MRKNNNFLIKLFVLFWLVCAVLCASQKSHQKREVHRIILKERSPRSHKKHGSSGHHGHTHSRKKGHKNKIKKDSDESVSSSIEESESGENSFEEAFHRHKSHPKQTNKKPSYPRSRFPPNLDIEETRQYPFREELSQFSNSDWIPLHSDHLHLPSEHHYSTLPEHHREKGRRNKRKPKKHSHKPHIKNKPYVVEPMTSTSFQSLSFDSSTLYPPIDVISSFAALNKNILQSNPSVLTTSFEPTTLKSSDDKLKNHKQTYDVTEGHAPELIVVPDKPDFGPLDFGTTGKFDFKGLDNHSSQNRGVKYRGRSKY